MLERYRYENGGWQLLDPLVVPQLSDVALPPDRLGRVRLRTRLLKHNC